MLLQVEAGTERWVQWARRKADDLEATRRDLKIEAMTKVFYPEAGTQVWVKCSREAGVAIRISGSSDFGWAFYVNVDDFQILKARVNRDGSVAGPLRGKIAVLSGSSFTVGFSATGLAGTEDQHDGEMQVGLPHGRASSVGHNTYAPTLGGFLPAVVVGTYECEIMAQYKATDGSYRLIFRYVTNIDDPMSMRYALIKYLDGAWSEVNAPAWTTSALGATTGVSVVNTSLPKPPRQYKYDYATPLGGSITFDSNFEWFGQLVDARTTGVVGNSIFDLNTAPIAPVRLARTYVTSVTPSATVTDYDDATHSVPQATGCWLDVQATTETWLSRIDPDTLVHTELERFSRSFTVKVFIVSVGGGAPFVAQTAGRIKDMVPAATTPVMYSGQTLDPRPVGYSLLAPLAQSRSTATLTPAGYVFFDTWLEITSVAFAPGSGPSYIDNTGATQRAGNYPEGTASPRLEVRVSGAAVYSDNIATVGSPVVAGALGQVLTSAAGKFAGQYALTNSSGTVSRSVFWDGAAMSTVDNSGGLVGICIIYKDGSRYILGRVTGERDVYVDGVLVLTIPAPASGVRTMLLYDYLNPDKFYGVESVGLAGVGYDYIVKQVGGVWTLSQTAMNPADSWKFNGDTLLLSGGLRLPHSSLATDRLGALNATPPTGT